MTTLSCDCGFSASDESKYKVEATMWHHAIQNHGELLKSMSVDMLEQWLVEQDAKLTASA